MKVNLDYIKNNNIELLYEQAFLHFLQLKELLFYFPAGIPKENNGISVPIYRVCINDSNENITDINHLSYRQAAIH